MEPHRVRRLAHSLKRDICPAGATRHADSPISMTSPRTTLIRGHLAPLPYRSSAAPSSTLPQRRQGSVSSARFAAVGRLLRSYHVGQGCPARKVRQAARVARAMRPAAGRCYVRCGRQRWRSGSCPRGPSRCSSTAQRAGRRRTAPAAAPPCWHGARRQRR